MLMDTLNQSGVGNSTSLFLNNEAAWLPSGLVQVFHPTAIF